MKNIFEFKFYYKGEFVSSVFANNYRMAIKKLQNYIVVYEYDTFTAEEILTKKTQLINY